MSTGTHKNLLAEDAPVIELPEDLAVTQMMSGDSSFGEVVSAHPESCLCWALLAERALEAGNLDSDIAAYAYARTGYHRGLDGLRRAGWKGAGPIPWEHGPNRGFLRALWALARAAERLGETAEHQRCTQFLRDSSETGYAELAG